MSVQNGSTRGGIYIHVHCCMANIGKTGVSSHEHSTDILDEWRCGYGLLGIGGGRFVYFD